MNGSHVEYEREMRKQKGRIGVVGMLLSVLHCLYCKRNSE